MIEFSSLLISLTLCKAVSLPVLAAVCSGVQRVFLKFEVYINWNALNLYRIFSLFVLHCVNVIYVIYVLIANLCPLQNQPLAVKVADSI